MKPAKLPRAKFGTLWKRLLCALLGRQDAKPGTRCFWARNPRALDGLWYADLSTEGKRGVTAQKRLDRLETAPPETRLIHAVHFSGPEFRAIFCQAFRFMLGFFCLYLCELASVGLRA